MGGDGEVAARARGGGDLYSFLPVFMCLPHVTAAPATPTGCYLYPCYFLDRNGTRQERSNMAET